ncbi:nucleoside monophosphate kinase [Candidatus Roizmanbacteria bacterium]|nr:nucleoside monophosphate kinase [Candidatus Roizmanbacteria bacterium]
MKLVLMGIQGSGKSTQGNLLSKQLKIPYLSTGHIFREIAKEKTQLGAYVKNIMNAGHLIPDDKTIEIVNSYISRPEYQRGYILDGFPRTIKQAEEFKNDVDKVIYLDVPDKEALWRLSHRNDLSRRDETLEALRKRIELYNSVTKPVIEYYREQGKLVTIDGTQKIEEVNQEILKSLGKQVIKDQIQEWKKKEKSIIAIVGLAGSGKTEAAQFFAKEIKLPVISFGKIINELIEKEGLEHTEVNHRKFRVGLRKKYGMEAMAVLNEQNIRGALEKNMILVIEAMRSWEEYLYLKKQFPNTKIYILAVHADKALRYKRLEQREDRKGFYGEERDMNELMGGANMAPTIAYADFLVKNNFSLDDLHDKLEQVYRVVFFS